VGVDSRRNVEEMSSEHSKAKLSAVEPNEKVKMTN